MATLILTQVSGGNVGGSGSVIADEITITTLGGGSSAALAVFNGLAEQVLRGQGTGIDAVWEYQDNLRSNPSGELIIDGVGLTGSNTHLEIINGISGSPSISPTISVEGTGTDIDLVFEPKGDGNLYLDQVQWPNVTVPENSILIATSDNVLEPLTPLGTSPCDDQVLYYDCGTGTLVWENVSNIVTVQTNAFGTLTGDSGSVTAQTPTDTLNVVGGVGVNTSISGSPNILTIDIDTSDITLGDLGDVIFGSPVSEGDILIYRDGSPGGWVNEPSTVTDEFVKVSATDTTTGHLSSKIVEGTGIDLAILNPGVDENLEISVDISELTINLGDLTDVVVGSPLNPGDVLVYGGSPGTWSNVPPSTFDQNLWATFTADTGTTTADTTTDTLTIAGGTAATTSISGDVVTIDVDASEINLGDLGDVIITGSPSPSEGEILIYREGSPGGWTNEPSTVTDEFVKVSAADTTTGYLATKIVEGTGIDLTILNGGANETLEISVDISELTINLGDLSDVVIGSPLNPGDILVYGGSPATWNNTPASSFDQNLWATFTADTGTTTANTTTDTLTVTGGNAIDTTISGDVLTIDVDPSQINLGELGDVVFGSPVTMGYVLGWDGNIWKPVDPTTASSGISAGPGISVDSSGSPAVNVISLNICTVPVATGSPPTPGINDTVAICSGSSTLGYTLSNIASVLPVAQTAWTTISGDTGSATADSTTDSITFVGGTGVTTTGSNSPDTLTIAVDFTEINLGNLNDVVLGSPVTPGDVLVYGGSPATWNNVPPSTFDQNLFVTVTGDSGTITADSPTDTLNIAGGNLITTSVVGDVVTIDSDFILSSPVSDGDILIYRDGSPGGWVNEPSTTTDEFVKVSATDTTTGYLASKIVEGTGVDIAILNGGGDEDLEISVDVSELTINLGDLSDVVIGSPLSSGDVLVYGGSPATWNNVPPSTFDQNLWATFNADSGSTTADTTTDTLTITGGTGISTAVTADTITITNDSPNVDQNIYETFAGDSGTPTTANTITDTLAVSGGTNISTVASADTITINGVNIWNTVAGDSGSTTPNVALDTVTIAGGTGITTAVAGDTVTITNSSPNVDQNLWATFNADTGTTTANITTDTLTVSGGTGVTTSITGDALTITASVSMSDITDVILTGSPAPADGDVLIYRDGSPAGWMNEQLASLIGAGDLPAVQARRTTDLSIGTTFATATYDTTDVETDSAILDHSEVTNTSRITVKEDGLYLVGYNLSGINYQADASTETHLEARVILNGSATGSPPHGLPGSNAHDGNYFSSTGTTSEDTFLSNQFLVELTAGDYMEVQTASQALRAVTGYTATVDANEGGGIIFWAIRQQGSQGEQGVPGSGSSITIQDEGVNVAGTPHTTINFRGATISATDGSPSSTVNVDVTASTSTLMSFSWMIDGNGDNKWMGTEEKGLNSDATQQVMPFSGTLTGIAYSNRVLNTDVDIDVHRAASGSGATDALLTSWTVTSCRVAYRNDLSISITKGDKLAVYMAKNTTSADRPLVTLYIDVDANTDGPTYENFSGNF